VIVDWDDAYANAPHIPDGDGYPSRWEALAAESPALRMPRPGLCVRVWVGDGERPEFVRQAMLLANIWTGVGADMEQTKQPRRHHFSVIEGLTHPGSGLVEAIVGDQRR
jgi:arylformamidase